MVRRSVRSAGLAAALATVVPIVLALAGAAPAFGADTELQQAIARGKENFFHNPFGGGGRVCNSCHLEGGTQPGQRPDGQPIPSLTNAGAIFPRVRKQDHALITLADQIRGCVAGAIRGNPPEYGSDELNSLVSYVTSLSQGKPIEMGGAPK
jgi:thiosulfate dehydrogenase